MTENMYNFIDRMDNESKTKFTAIKNFCLVKSGKSIVGADEGTEAFDTIIDGLNTISEFVFDNYKSLLDWLATTEVVIDKVVYKTRQNNIRYLQTLYKDAKDVNKQITFLEVKDFKIPVMTGLRIDLATYNKLLATGNYKNNVIDELIYLKELSNFLIDNNGYTMEKNGKVILDVNDLLKRTHVNEGLVKKIKKELKEAVSATGVTDVKPLNKLVKSLSDLEKEVHNTIKLGSLYTVEKIEEVDRVYKDANSSVEEMLNIMEASEDTNFNHDGKTIAALSKYVHSVADLLSFTSMKYFYYSILVDTEVAALTALKEFSVNKNPNDAISVISSIGSAIDSSINGLIGIFK